MTSSVLHCPSVMVEHAFTGKSSLPSSTHGGGEGGGEGEGGGGGGEGGGRAQRPQLSRHAFRTRALDAHCFEVASSQPDSGKPFAPSFLQGGGAGGEGGEGGDGGGDGGDGGDGGGGEGLGGGGNGDGEVSGGGI